MTAPQLEAKLVEMEALVRPGLSDDARPALADIARTVFALTEQIRHSAAEGDADLAACLAIEAMRHVGEFEITRGVPEAERSGLGSVASSDESLAALIRAGIGSRMGLWRAGAANYGHVSVPPEQLSTEYAAALDKLLASNSRKSYTQATNELAPRCGIKGPAIRKHLRKYPTEKYPPKNR